MAQVEENFKKGERKRVAVIPHMGKQREARPTSKPDAPTTISYNPGQGLQDVEPREIAVHTQGRVSWTF